MAGPDPANNLARPVIEKYAAALANKNAIIPIEYFNIGLVIGF
jgi:hypothetical protein